VRFRRLIFLTATLSLAALSALAQERAQPQAAASRLFEQGEQALEVAEAARARGDARAAQAHLSEATIAFERALQADAAFVDAYTKFAFALFAAGRADAGVPHLERVARHRLTRSNDKALRSRAWTLGGPALALALACAGVRSTSWTSSR